MSDEELDRDWKPNGRRPQSTIARTFSAELMDIFRIDNSLADLDNQVDQRRQNVGKTTQELASLEARIREMEERLKGNSGASSGRPAVTQDAFRPVNNASSQSQQDGGATADAVADKHSSRPGTARAVQQAPSSGIMPPTPGASEDGDRNGE
jgi:ATP phosphoribosyltransferase regulatory subunit HisZ